MLSNKEIVMILKIVTTILIVICIAAYIGYNLIEHMLEEWED